MIIHPHTSYFVPDFHGDDPDHTQGSQLYTQVGSPAVRLWLASCTAWVKGWSKAMDFLQTIFKNLKQCNSQLIRLCTLGCIMFVLGHPHENQAQIHGKLYGHELSFIYTHVQ